MINIDEGMHNQAQVRFEVLFYHPQTKRAEL